jgi:hypothetical protein
MPMKSKSSARVDRFGRATKNKREGGVAVRSVVSRELADTLRRIATEENCTLSDLIAVLLERAVQIK